MKIGDFLVIVFVLSFGFAYLVAKGGKERGHTYTVYSRGKEVVSLSLERDTTLYIEGILGKTVVRVENHAVMVLSSPCRDKLCVKFGPIKMAGASVACVPNGVIVVINGSNEFESITY